MRFDHPTYSPVLLCQCVDAVKEAYPELDAAFWGTFTESITGVSFFADGYSESGDDFGFGIHANYDLECMHEDDDEYDYEVEISLTFTNRTGKNYAVPLEDIQNVRDFPAFCFLLDEADEGRWYFENEMNWGIVQDACEIPLLLCMEKDRRGIPSYLLMPVPDHIFDGKNDMAELFQIHWEYGDYQYTDHIPPLVKYAFCEAIFYLLETETEALQVEMNGTNIYVYDKNRTFIPGGMIRLSTDGDASSHSSGWEWVDDDGED